ncbi:CBS domain-containing protein [uncultured Psychromonas sp.]|uniref:CBS domain-containing protein n=1 Tax=uncultured Psychromonas sp. TaxID=173974 RepID=UPI0026316CF1|nr:CBS domain-containing protein [uncultured Psychromonas sp.]
MLENLQVKQFMTGKNIAFTKEMNLQTAVEKLLASNLIGGPVVNESGHVVGWLSEQDCLAKIIEASYYSDHSALVEDVMSDSPLSIPSTLSIVDLAQKMIHEKPKMYPVLDEDNIYVGLITRKMVLGAMKTQL